MYDDKEIEVENKATLLIVEIKMALARGTKHYRKSDNELLTTEHEIIQALNEEGGIYFEPIKKKERQ